MAREKRCCIQHITIILDCQINKLTNNNINNNNVNKNNSNDNNKCENCNQQ